MDSFDEAGTTGGDEPKRGWALLRDNPLGLLFVGFAVGTIVGVLAPVSRMEREKIAPLRDEVVDMARRTADGVVEHGRGGRTRDARGGVRVGHETRPGPRCGNRTGVSHDRAFGVILPAKCKQDRS